MQFLSFAEEDAWKLFGQIQMTFFTRTWWASQKEALSFSVFVSYVAQAEIASNLHKDIFFPMNRHSSSIFIKEMLEGKL